MNMGNPSNTIHLRRLIERVAGVDHNVSMALVRAMMDEGYGVIHAPCAECRSIHESYPTVRAFHHPSCETRKKCRECGGDIPGLSCEHFTQQVGSLCDTCAA
ncbi:hypothetical protein UFOVP1157_45 [uncultured Caudovirales phage]|uniref:Uncharacterized protein n=1 Tax=uncultured Caudovirales phage TaxID=2100421 RepID=A0A6J5PTL2_9CAUD|nr:hypothetical protein UFOVP497_50 [uncultured Caudovirales phage]CAB4164400.1 hypothetical protein UFOVP834_26 [uncultured Caudovirales phage]CAB4172388.1 hypothetical protein UFOVP922_45 [uncultured Caudovirales phage]CAB4177715.1 hypothetical protein UFOVP1006_38 [uncultured Caudovirales phage]CAB4184115.1 hypothetical protein UFOVP1096_42 [uncultured Caudovirales phage]